MKALYLGALTVGVMAVLLGSMDSVTPDAGKPLGAEAYYDQEHRAVVVCCPSSQKSPSRITLWSVRGERVQTFESENWGGPGHKAYVPGFLFPEGVALIGYKTGNEASLTRVLIRS